MCHSRDNNGKINRLQERCLRIIYPDKQSSFEMLLEKDGSASVHNRYLQIVATDMYKIKNDLSPLKNSQFNIPSIRTVHYGSESITFLGPKM